MDPTACERDFAAAERELMEAMQVYKQRSGRMFPTWGEVLEVLRGLGYVKAAADRSVEGAPAATFQEPAS